MSAALRRALLGGLVAAGLALSGCATAPAGTPQANATASATAPMAGRGLNPADPWEAWNRRVFAFNDTVDRVVLKPVAEAYQTVVPSLVRTGVSNVLGNIRDAWSSVNHLLQGKLQDGVEMGARVLTNTTLGLGGLLDPATEMRLPRKSEDLGQTFGRWGMGPGPYLMLPFLGPSTVRDTAGGVFDRAFGPSALPPTSSGQLAVTGLDVVNTRARLLQAGSLLDQGALDRYAFLRDAYLAQRLDAVYDGAPPLGNLDEFADEKPTPPPASKPAGATAPAPAAAKPAVAPASAPASSVTR